MLSYCPMFEAEISLVESRLKKIDQIFDQFFS